MNATHFKVLIAFMLACGLVACESKTEEAVEEPVEETAEKAAEAANVDEEKPTEEAAEKAARDADYLAMSYKGEAERVNDVMLYKFANKPATLGFYNEDVDCASIKETPEGDDRVVATAELNTDEKIVDPGAVEVKRWLYSFDTVDADPVQEADVTVTKVEPTTFEGTVKLTGKLEDDAIEMSGPFVATICDFEKG